MPAYTNLDQFTTGAQLPFALSLVDKNHAIAFSLCGGSFHISCTIVCYIYSSNITNDPFREEGRDHL